MNIFKGFVSFVFRNPKLSIILGFLVYFLFKKTRYEVTNYFNDMTDKGKRWLRVLEGVRYKAYTDTKGNSTIGVGHLIKPNESWMLTSELSPKQVDELYVSDIASHKRPVTDLQLDGVALLPHQVDALISLAFNMGVAGFKRTKLFAYLSDVKKDFDPAVIQDYWDNISYGGRRQSEIDLFLSGIYKDSLGKVLN